MDNPTVSADAANNPYNVEQLRAHIRLLDATQDDVIERTAQAAAEYLQEYTGRSLLEREFTWTLDGFTKGRSELSDFWYNRFPVGVGSMPTIVFPIRPLASVTSIKYYDTAEAQQTLDAADYDVDTVSGRVYPSSSASVWPQTMDRPNAVEIIFRAGYGDNETDIPSRLRQALALLTAHWFENREAYAALSLSEVPAGFYTLTDSYKRF